jgi:hypothetical protein
MNANVRSRPLEHAGFWRARRVALRPGLLGATAAAGLIGLAVSVLLLARPGALPPRSFGAAAGFALWLGGAITLAVAFLRAKGATRRDDASPALSLSLGGLVALVSGGLTVNWPWLAVAAFLLTALCESALRSRLPPAPDAAPRVRTRNSL